MDVPASLLDFPLLQEGPPWLVGRRPHPRRTALPWRLLLMALLTWLPLLALSLLHGGTVQRAFLRDASLHVRLLVSLPIFIAAGPYIQGHLAMAVRQFVTADLIEARHLPLFQEIARRVMRLRDLTSVELGLLLISFALSFLDAPFQPGSAAWLREGPQGPLTLSGWWYLAVCQPFVRFVVLQWLWRSILWAVFLFRVSRLPLAVVPTHPDGAGGLGFLGTCQASFSVLVFALAFTLASRYWQRHTDVDLTRTAKDLLTFALLALSVLLAPLLPFCRQLIRAKRRGDHDFSAVAAWHSRRFEQRWFHSQEPAGQDPLGAPEFSSLVDLGSSFNVARKMLWFPVDRRAVLAIIGSAMAPMVPILVVDRRFLDVMLALGKGLL